MTPLTPTCPLMAMAVLDLPVPALLCTMRSHHCSPTLRQPSLPGVYPARSPAFKLLRIELLLLCSDVKRGFVAEEEDKKQKWRRWKSIYVMYFTMFLTALSEFTCMSHTCHRLSEFTCMSQGRGLVSSLI